MNLNTISEVKRPTSADQITQWRDGYAWLAGGTWSRRSPPIRSSTSNGSIGRHWSHLPPASTSRRRAALQSSTGSAAGGVARGLAPARVLRRVFGFVQDLECRHRRRQHLHVVAGRPDDLADRGARRNLYVMAAQRAAARRPLRRLRYRKPHQHSSAGRIAPQHPELPASALSKRFAFRHASLTHLGRSAALLIGTQNTAGDDLLITITAATPRPIRLKFKRAPSSMELRLALDERIP